MHTRQRESAMIVMVVVATAAVMLAIVAAAGVWFVRKRPSPTLGGPIGHDALPGSPPAEA